MQIAREFDMDWKDIAELNGLSSPYTLQPGQQLKLPGMESSPPPPPPVEDQPTDSEYSGQIYIVQPGDYLYALARTFGLNWQTLASANQISYPYIVYPGQEIQISLYGALVAHFLPGRAQRHAEIHTNDIATTGSHIFQVRESAGAEVDYRQTGWLKHLK